MYGSSPHGWGTQNVLEAARVEKRFIPTRVGNTFKPVFWGPYVSVHPHTGGEHFLWFFMTHSYIGSSPHGWGTRWYFQKNSVLFRFIPTRVGNTLHVPEGLFSVSVHPHTGGEHGWVIVKHNCPYGSSPHGWGTLD